MRYGTNGSTGGNVEISTGRQIIEQSTVNFGSLLRLLSKLLCDGMTFFIAYSTRVVFVLVNNNAKANEPLPTRPLLLITVVNLNVM